MKVIELKEKLTELNIPFKTNLKKSELEELLETPPKKNLMIGNPVKLK